MPGQRRARISENFRPSQGHEGTQAWGESHHRQAPSKGKKPASSGAELGLGWPFQGLGVPKSEVRGVFKAGGSGVCHSQNVT